MEANNLLKESFGTIPDINIRIGVHPVKSSSIAALCWADLGSYCRVNSLELRRRPENGTLFVRWPYTASAGCAVSPAPELAARIKALLIEEYNRKVEMGGEC